MPLGGEGGGGPENPFFSQQLISQKPVRTSLKKQLDQRVQLPLEGARTSILRKHSHLWFSGWGSGSTAPPSSLSPPMGIGDGGIFSYLS